MARSLFLLTAVMLLCTQFVTAQMLTIKPRKPIVCYESHYEGSDHIPPPNKFQQWKQGRSARVKTATFEIEYINFPADNQAKNAFQFAVDIWETQLASSVPIRLRAQWASLDPGVLGQAIWGTAHANFDGAQHNNTFYPVALAEKIAGQELNPSDEPDVVATFSSTTDWYYGTDGNTPTGKMDLVTVVLHEIAHGLGFTDTYNGESSQGSVGLENGGVRVPFVYDLYIENEAGQNLFSQFDSPSVALKDQLVSDQLFLNSPLIVASEETRPKIYAPSAFDAGSSIAHLDEETFITPGDANKLMTPQISRGESIHSLGSIVLELFSDMGWVSTKIDHTPLKDTEQKDGTPYLVKTKILSDNNYDQSQVVLHYTTNNISFTDVVMTSTGIADEFQASLPGITTNGSYGYYISVVDELERTFTNPGKIQAQNEVAEQGLIVFNIRSDTDAPSISHTPIEHIFDDDNTMTITAEVTDNISVADVQLEYSINGNSIQNTLFAKSASADTYTATINLPALEIDDAIEYRIIAIDNSSNANQSQSPATGFHTVFVTGIKPARDFYANNFNLPSNYFIGNSFSITTPDGFADAAIHSSHPYENGSGPNDESSYSYQLQVPIRINSEDPTIKFDEIVLVEPGENGSVFGDADFYDYVVVEGSDDGGTTWKPFADGYDSRASSAWLTRYNSNIVDDNSAAIGTPQHFRERTINMLNAGQFDEGDEVLIRFRLFADQAAHGWGWAIDNLSIQETITGVEQEADRYLKIYPNPAIDHITVEVSANVALRIMNAGGQIISNQVTRSEGRTDIDISNYNPGLYLIQVELAGETVSKRFLKIR